jgi:hypothetical protein
VIALLALTFLAQDPGPTPAPPRFQDQVGTLLRAIDQQNLERTVRALVACGTRHVLSATEGARGTGAARDLLQQQLEACVAGSGGRLSVGREAYKVQNARLGREIEVVNVVARLRGTNDPERIYVVGGHYDSINSDGRDATRDAPGANDDASGTAVVVEACRVLSRHPFPATLLFVCYDGEEQGLVGSGAHAKALAAAGARVDGMITNDIVGNTRGMDGKTYDGWLRCFSYSARGNDSTSRSLARAATRAAREHVAGFDVRLVLRGDRYGRGGDHRSFFNEGFPAIRFSEPREDYSRQHKDVSERDGKPYGDLPEFVDFGYLGKVCAVNVALLAELASAPPPPSQLTVSGTRDRYAIDLRWPEVPGVAGYELVWRLTTAPDWEHALRVDAGGRHRLDELGLDDVVVGVRSVGADGSRSRVTAPPEPDALQQRGATRDR